MRKILTLLLLVHSVPMLFAQDNQIIQAKKKDKGFYLRGGLGYAITHAGQTSGPVGIYSGTYLDNSIYNVKAASFSAGLRGHLGFGYMFNKSIGVELSSETGMVNTMYTYSSSVVNLSQSNQSSTNTTIHYKAFFPFILSPSLVMQTGEDTWNIYARVGVAIPLSHRIDIDEDEVVSQSGSRNEYKYTELLKTSFSVGATAAAGVSYKVSERFKIWGEISVLSVALFTKELDLETATLNGIDNYANANRPKIPFSLNSNNYDANMANSIPFSNVALNVGVSWKLPEMKVKKKTKKKHVTPREYNRH